MSSEFSTEKKDFDAIKFKLELQENAWKNNGAKNLHEYVQYSNKIASKSPLHEKYKNLDD
ncbi:MAG: hypothetical protein LBT10_06165 [Methanobrevibacter sp.]|jgi:hypothetical protein|nr:hypothetical protein [Methanobrevibacter sp.]